MQEKYCTNFYSEKRVVFAIIVLEVFRAESGMEKTKIYISSFILSAFAFVFFTNPAFAAAASISDVAENISDSSESLPGLITGISYLFALLLGVTGILKLRDHVENAQQTPLRIPIIRFFAGGALLALPIVIEAANNSIGTVGLFGMNAKMENLTSNSGAIINIASGGGGTAGGVNDIMGNFIASTSSVPGLITGFSYLLGVLAVVIGIMKVRDHVENQEQTPLREGVIRLLIGGALFSLPTVYQAVESTITGDGAGIAATINTILPTVANYTESSRAVGVMDSCQEVIAATNDGIGATICRFVGRTGATPAFLIALSYMFGLVIGVWALLKVRDHVLNPQQTSIWEGMSRLIAAGAFFAMPYLAGVFQSALTGGNAFFTGNQFTTWMHAGAVTTACASGAPLALDMTVACFMRDIMTPAHVLFSHFAFVAGLVFIMIGITRIMKSAQDGARGPGGLGTIMTFVTAGVLISYNTIIEFFTASISTIGGVTATKAALSYTTGMTAAEVQHAEIIVAAILQFMIIIGLISFIRGWFIIRDVAEGNQQASLMAGATHVIGGALAINLGPILSAVQQTLNITAVGLTIS